MIDAIEQGMDEILQEASFQTKSQSSVATQSDNGVVNDFIADHPSDEDVGLDGDVLDGGEDVVHHSGDGVVNDPDGDGAVNNPEGDGDDQQHVLENEGNLGDNEGHEDVPLVTRIRKPSERILLQKLKKGVYDKDDGGSSSASGGSSSANLVTLE
ncbi:unnamed protein product [Lactuca virosa]|uniref:Uncharacterized protein n=1 Tax=Lactuca virosa TaxID=75947 RepID=A0AAU9LYQ1_9ASTR|nr:unnamed protein product [Lactuca virosa]